MARVLLATIVMLLVTGFGWSAWAEVEEIVRAAGRVVPAGRTKTINHPHGRQGGRDSGGRG